MISFPKIFNLSVSHWKIQLCRNLVENLSNQPKFQMGVPFIFFFRSSFRDERNKYWCMFRSSFEMNETKKDERFFRLNSPISQKFEVSFIFFFIRLLEMLHLFLEKHCLTPLSFWILPSANLLPQPTPALNQTQTRAPCEAGALVLAILKIFITNIQIWMKDERNKRKMNQTKKDELVFFC